jgi:hypothetical protein
MHLYKLHELKTLYNNKNILVFSVYINNIHPYKALSSMDPWDFLTKFSKHFTSSTSAMSDPYHRP